MPQLSVLLFGSFRAQLDGQALTEFHSNKTRALLAYLMVESHRPQRRDSLVGLLWAHTSDTSARRSLSQTLYTLRELIDDQSAQPPFLTVSRDAIQFNNASDYTLDVARFRQLLAECERHALAGIEACAECAGRLCEATALYQGKFLEDFFVDDSEAFEDWAVVQREALNEAAPRAVRLMGAAEVLLATVSDSFLPSDRMSFDPFITRIRARLAEPELAEAWTEGHALTLEQAADSAVM